MSAAAREERMSVTAQSALIAALPRLRTAGIPDAATDARALLAHAMDIAPSRLTLHLPDPLPAEILARFDAAITARANRQPVSQITGHRLFWGRSFRVTQDTLDPRPETEILVQAALQNPFGKVLDLGTGTGCILLSLLADMPMATGVGSDVSAAALAVATRNAADLGLSNRALLTQSDWFAGVAGCFDLIVSNPPYIAADEMPGLAPEVLRWEPHGALTPGGDGLGAYRIIAQGAGARLLPGGRLLLEIGPTQADSVMGYLAAQGFKELHLLRDLDNRPRVISARKATGTGA